MWDPLAGLRERQIQQLAAFEEMLVEFNRRINLISREDESDVFVHHILHSLFLAVRDFPPGAAIVDWGTGGGLPAIPLAIALPHVHVVAVDAIHKKVQAVRAMARRLGIENLEARQGRAENVHEKASYSVSRAAAPLADLWRWHEQLTPQEQLDVDANCWKPGLICLKGGDLSGEIREIGGGVDVECIDLRGLSNHSYFDEKVIITCRGEVS